MKILAIAATNHNESINKKLLTYTASVIQERFAESQIELLDLVDYEMPLYRQDREAEGGIPQKAQEFFGKIGDSDAVIISFAEHNGGFTAVYKNLFDWMSRINQKVFQDKPVVLMAASPGPRGGAGVLAAAESGAPYFGMDVKAKVSMPVFKSNFDLATGEVSNEEIKAQIHHAVEALQ
ncbi:MAG: NAD(P)H-dependent oxidoreductase [Myxococcota bacterium]